METDLLLTAVAAAALVALVIPYKLPRLGLGLAVLIALAGLLMFAMPATTESRSGCVLGHCGTVEVVSYGLDRVFGGFLLGYAAIWGVIAAIRISRQASEEGEEGEEADLPRGAAHRS